MTNQTFLETIKKSFETYLDVGTSRSTAKLKALHGAIALDLQNRFGADFEVKSQGIGDGKESKIGGRYYPKAVDITISKNGEVVAGYAVKFVMRNYSQNSNNYFENMLGETANIRAASIPYFQIFIIFDRLPHFYKTGVLAHWEEVTANNLHKYFALSQDNADVFFHAPDKTLFVLLHLKEDEMSKSLATDKDYNDFYRSALGDGDLLSFSDKIADDFGNSVILNDYEDFAERSVQIAKGRLKGGRQ